MARLTRKTSKLFCENALQSDVGQFGSLNAGTKVETKDINTIQNLPAWQDGWQAAGLGQNCYPTRQERNGLDYVQSYMVNYLNQEGIPEYDSGTTYYIGSVVKLINGTDVQLFKSIADNNTDNALTNTTYWDELSLGGGITIINNTTSPSITDDLETVKLYTQSGFNAIDTIYDNELNFVRYAFTDIDITSYETVTTNTDTVYAKDGLYCANSSSASTLSITKNSTTITVYATVFPIKAGTHFTSSVAGKFYYYEGQ